MSPPEHLHQNRLGAFESLRVQAEDACRQTDELVREHPAASVVAVFAVGLGLGLAASLLLAPRRRPPSWYERYLPNWASPESMRNAVGQVFG